METKEKRKDEKKTVATWPNIFCCGTGEGPWEMPGCCESMSETGDFSSMMNRCMKMCRWFLLVLVILGITLLLLGYYLDASIIRVLWMFFAGFIALMGTLGLILGGRMMRTCCGMK